MARKIKKTNYLASTYLVPLIVEAKHTYCWFADEESKVWDYWVDSFDEINPDEMNRRLAELQADRKTAQRYAGKTIEDLIVRVRTYDHVPTFQNSTGVTKPIITNFPPFKHVRWRGNDFEVVGISHWNGDTFCQTHGRHSDKLGRAYALMVDKVSTKGNWRNYSYLDEMKSSALLQLCQQSLKFDETRPSANGQLNAFSYWTSIVENSFKRYLNEEKRVRNLRDDLLEEAGMSPSMERQLQNEKESKIQ